MDLEQLFKATPKAGWLSDVPALLAQKGKLSHSEQESKQVQKGFLERMEQRDFDAAANWACIGLALDADNFIPAIRRKGILRPSAYAFQFDGLNKLVNSLLQSPLAAQAPARVVSYLESMFALYVVSADVRTIFDRLVEAVKADKEKLLKGLLATVDLFFMGAVWRGVLYGDPSFSSRNVHFHSVEDYAAAFSYIFFLHRKHVGPCKFNPAIDADAATSDRYMNLLVDAAHVRAFYEFETLIDVFDYRLHTTGKNTEFRLVAPSPEFEKAVRLGYIHTRMQALANVKEHSSPDAASLRTAGGKLYQVAKDQYVQLKTDPVKRYFFGVPAAPNIWDVVTHHQLFDEENTHLNGASKALLTSIPDLLKFDIGGNLVLEDILRAQRIISFFRWYAAHHLMPIVLNEPAKAQLVFQSVVPHFTIEQLRYLLGVVVPQEKVDAIIDLWTWNPAREPYFDLQYQPFLDSGEGRLVPMNILAGSNLLRNVLAIRRKRLYEDGSVDPVSDMLAAALQRHMPHVATGKTFSFRGKQGEIDVAARLDDTLFIFECKNSLLPTGPHELRTSWDYVEKAVRQLTSFCDLFPTTEFRKYMESRFGFPLNGVTQVMTCIVMANRMFMGYRAGGHPIRGTFELVHFMEQGTVSIRDESLCYWTSSTFASDDLVRYLRDDVVHRPQFASMVEYEEVYEFGNTTVRFQTWKLDLLILANALGFQKTARELKELKKSQAKPPIMPVNPVAHRPAPRRRPQSSEGKQRVGRNDPCPCGSKKKFKYCCLRSQEQW